MLSHLSQVREIRESVEAVVAAVKAGEIEPPPLWQCSIAWKVCVTSGGIQDEQNKKQESGHEQDNCVGVIVPDLIQTSENH